MASYVYVLRSPVTGQHLIGSTNDLHQRIARHNSFSSRAYRSGNPWECVYVEVLDTIDDARKRERYLKSLDGVDEKIRIIYSLPSRDRAS